MDALRSSYNQDTLSLLVTATSNSTNTNSTASFTFQVLPSEPSLSSRLLGLLGAVLVGLLILTLMISGSTLYRIINEQKQEKQMDAYFKAINRLYHQNIKMQGSSEATPLNESVIDSAQLVEDYRKSFDEEQVYDSYYQARQASYYQGPEGAEPLSSPEEEKQGHSSEPDGEEGEEEEEGASDFHRFYEEEDGLRHFHDPEIDTEHYYESMAYNRSYFNDDVLPPE